MSNFLSRGLKGVRRALHLPPVTLGNVATKYAPAALALGSGVGPLGAIATKIPGAAKIAGGLSAAKRVIGHHVPDVMRNGAPAQIGDLITGGPAAPPGAPGAPAAGGGTDWLGIAEGGLAGLSALNAAKASARQGQYQDRALQQAEGRWAQGAPLRAAGSAQLLNAQPPDLSATYNDPTNVFSRPVRRPLVLPQRAMR